MKAILLIILFLISRLCFSQNIVVNPGFEDTLACPNQIGQVSFAIGWSSWSITPDYYNACANTASPGFGVPVNNRGFQFAHTGQAYVGLFTFSVFVANQREFIGGQISAPMLIGQQYFVSFWANHADTSLVHLTTDKLGIKFSTVSFSLGNPDTVNNVPHVFSNSIISDTTNWVLIQGSFIADSAYTHFAIGNYFEDAQTNQSQIGTGAANYAYYLVDDVCLSANPLTCSDVTLVQEHIPDDEIKIYPNPFVDRLNITVVKPFSNATLKLKNILGQTVIEKTGLNGNSFRIVVPNPNGAIYFLELSEQGFVYRRKLVKNYF